MPPLVRLHEAVRLTGQFYHLRLVSPLMAQASDWDCSPLILGVATVIGYWLTMAVIVMGLTVCFGSCSQVVVAAYAAYLVADGEVLVGLMLIVWRHSHARR